MTRAAAVFLLVAGMALPLRSEVVATASADTLDLTQCYELAKKQSETLQISVEQIEQIEQQYKQTFASVMPNLSLNASQKWQEAGAPGTPSSFIATSNPQANLILTQPLFSGFREYAAMRGYKHEGKAAELQLKFADQQLFQNVASAFYQILSFEKNLTDTMDLLAMTEDRAKELRARERIGKSRVSEVLSVESQLASVKSQIEAVRSQIAVEREVLAFLIGQDASTVKLQDELTDLPPAQTEEAVLAKASSRSDVRSARETEQAQHEQIKIAWGAMYPQIGFVGDYYLYRYSLYRPIHWDATFNASLPIFSGGGQVAAVRLAESQWRAADDNARLVFRQALSQIRTDFLSLQFATSEFSPLREAYEKARDSYKLELREYRLGIVDNLTVLQAMNAVQSAQVSLHQTGYQIKLDYLQLKVATEELP